MWKPTRLITGILVAIETVVAIFYLVVFHEPGRSDAITNTIVDGITIIVVALYAIFVLPATILVIRDTRPELALILALGAVAAFVASFVVI